MKEIRRLGVHVLLLLLAATVAFIEAQPEDASNKPLQPGEVELWKGKVEDVSSVRYETKKKTVLLEAKKDDAGRYYEGKVTPAATPPPAEPDAGAAKAPPVKEEAFLSVTVAEKLVEKVATMRAKAAIGAVAADRTKVFGLEEPEGTLTVVVGGTTHTLVIGGPAPGSGDRYARDDSQQVYVIDASITRDLDGGAGRLTERSLHTWKPTEVERAELIGEGKGRSLLRGGTEGRRFWADKTTPEQNDETAANWLQKVDRLRPVKFVASLPEGAKRVVRIEYHAQKDKLGWLELYRVEVEDDGKAEEEQELDPHANPHDDPHATEEPADAGAASADAGDADAGAAREDDTKAEPPPKKSKVEYYLVSEQLRMPGTVAVSLAEQVEQDLGSVLP